MSIVKALKIKSSSRYTFRVHLKMHKKKLEIEYRDKYWNELLRFEYFNKHIAGIGKLLKSEFIFYIPRFIWW